MKELKLPNKVGRPKLSPGEKGKYTMSPQAVHQRAVAPLKHGGRSRIMKEVINRMDLSDEQQEILSEAKLETWKKFQIQCAYFF